MSRNFEGQGSYFRDEKRDRYCWKLRWTDDTGKKCCKTFYAKTKKELKVKVDAYLDAKKKVEASKNGNNEYTIKEWFERWLGSVKKSVKPNTYEYYEYLSRCYIIPHFGDRLLGEIIPVEIQEMLNNLKRADGKNVDLAESTINGVRATFRAALRAAQKNRFIKDNPVRDTDRVKGAVKEVKAFSHEQVQLLLDIAEHKDYVHLDGQQKWQETDAQIYLRNLTYYFVLLDSGTGMREGEVLALQWSDINFEKKTVSVTKTVDGAEVGETKSLKSKRIIPISSDIIEKMKSWKTTQEEYATHHENTYTNRNIVFADSHGNYRNVRNFRERYWKKLCRAAGLAELDGYGIHSLRHYHATHLIMSGAKISAISKRLGHANVNITYKTYINVIEAMETELNDIIENVKFL